MDELTIAEAAARLGLSERVVRHRAQRGYLPARRVGARLLLIPADAVEAMRGTGPLKPGPKPRAEVERQRALGPLKRGRKGTV